MRRVLDKAVVSVCESYPGAQWLAHYEQNKNKGGAHALAQESISAPTLQVCNGALNQFMPELVPLWQHLLSLTDAGDQEAFRLSMYCAPPTVAACSQSVWTRYSPILVRNYDNRPELWEGRLLKSRWHEVNVIAMTDGFWGVLDGMNERGLAVSLAVGGQTVGEGFAMPLILRYILEFCGTTQEAIKVLCRVPVSMAYNVTLLDRDNRYATVEVCPGLTPRVLQLPFAVGHQGDFCLRNFSASSRSFECKEALLGQLHSPSSSIDSFIHAFKYAPLFTADDQHSFGTLYTAIYNPSTLSLEYRLPDQRRIHQSFERFYEKEI